MILRDMIVYLNALGLKPLVDLREYGTKAGRRAPHKEEVYARRGVHDGILTIESIRSRPISCAAVLIRVRASTCWAIAAPASGTAE